MASGQPWARRRRTATLALTVGFALALALVAGAFADDRGTAETLDVASETLAIDVETQAARFSGSVVVRRGDWVLECSALTAQLDEGGEISQAVAEGPVVLAGPDVWVEAPEATYLRADESIVLSGGAEVRRGESRVTAESVTVWLQDEKVEMRGVRGRFVLEPRPPAPE